MDLKTKIIIVFNQNKTLFKKIYITKLQYNSTNNHNAYFKNKL